MEFVTLVCFVLVAVLGVRQIMSGKRSVRVPPARQRELLAKYATPYQHMSLPEKAIFEEKVEHFVNGKLWLGAGTFALYVAHLFYLRDKLHGAYGTTGEMLAVHACLLLGLRVVSWRSRAPAEIDLIAERTMGLSYQRWHVQVKNTDNDLDVDRVDREIGVAAGTGATHILFVVPRAGVSQTAQAELDAKTRLTHLQPYVLSAAAFDAPVQVGRLLRELRGQEARQTRIKRMEAERRERAG